MSNISNLSPLTTLKHTCGDTAETLDDVTGFVAQYTANSGTLQERKCNVVAVLITCSANSIRYTWTATPTNDSGTGVGHVLDADATNNLVMEGHKKIIDFSFINKVSGTDAILQITPFINN